MRNQDFHNYSRKGDFYFEELKKTKISLNFRGTGWDTLRYWEIMGLKAFLISQRLQIEIPNDFIEGKEIIYCMDDLSDLDDLCHFYLKHDSLRKAIAEKANAKTMEFHTVESRANYILKKIKV
jgi:spore maturation protein CgeB